MQKIPESQIISASCFSQAPFDTFFHTVAILHNKSWSRSGGRNILTYSMQICELFKTRLIHVVMHFLIFQTVSWFCGKRARILWLLATNCSTKTTPESKWKKLIREIPSSFLWQSPQMLANTNAKFQRPNPQS